MARNALDAVLGRLKQDGEELELRGALNFISPLTLTESDDGYDVAITSHVLGAVTYLREQDVSGTFTSSTEFINCRITGAITVTGTATFRGCKAAGAYAITATAIETDRSSARAIQVAGCTVSVLPTDLDPPNPLYGSGESGSLSLSSGTATLNPTNSTSFTDVTVSGTGSLRTDQAFLYVSGLLDISAAPAGAIVNAADGGGANASGATGGAAGGNGSTGGHSEGTSPVHLSVAGATGTTGAGTTPTQISGAVRHLWGAQGGASGAGGSANGGGTAGGAATAQVTSTFVRVRPRHYPPRMYGGLGAVNTTTANLALFEAYGGGCGSAGPSGAGDGATAGGGGGGGPHGAPPIVILARGIKRSGSTAVGAIRNATRTGGNGGNGGAGAAGGGGGAGGAGGTGIIICYDWLIGTAAPSGSIDAAGSAGGNGGNGAGTGAGGAGGAGGGGGKIVLKNMITGAVTVVDGVAGSSGSAASGATGGAGGAGGACAGTI